MTPREKRGVIREDVVVQGIHATGGYSHAAKVGNLLFIAGQVPKDVDGTVVGPGDIEAQAERVFENLKAVLVSAGVTFDDVVKLTTYTTDAAYRLKIFQVRGRYFKDYFPPNTFIVVKSLAEPSWLLEIEAIAACP